MSIPTYRVNVEITHPQPDFEDQLEYLVEAKLKELTGVYVPQGPVVFRVYPPPHAR